jgi:hypothetical protein
MPSSMTMVSWWLNGGEGVDAALPSWIAPRNISHEVFVRPSVAPAPHSVSSLAAPNERLIASLRPPSNPHIAIQEDLPGYPDLRDENDALRRQLAEMAISTARFRLEVLKASEGELVKLACAVAERVTRRELVTTPAIVVGWVREAIDALGAKEEAVIAVAPDLAAIVDPAEWSGLARGSIVVETDPSLGSFQCEVRVRSSTVDASSEGRVAAVARELGVSAE